MWTLREDKSTRKERKGEKRNMNILFALAKNLEKNVIEIVRGHINDSIKEGC